MPVVAGNSGRDRGDKVKPRGQILDHYAGNKMLNKQLKHATRKYFEVARAPPMLPALRFAS